MVERTTNQQMDELISKMSAVRDTDDPLSDAATNQLGVFKGEPKEDLRKITKETDMLLDVAGKDGFIHEPDQKLDYKDAMGLLFPITPNDPIFEDIKTMFEKEKYGSGVLMSTLTALAMIPGFGTLPKQTAKKIARDTAESIKLSERVAPSVTDLEVIDPSKRHGTMRPLPNLDFDRNTLTKNKRKPKPEDRKLNPYPQLETPSKTGRFTEQNTYDLPISNSVYDYIDGNDNYYSKLFEDIDTQLGKSADKDGNIKLKVFEKWLEKNAPLGQAKYTGLQNLVDNAKKEGVEKLSIENDIKTRYINNEIVFQEKVRRIDPNDNAFDEYGRLQDIPHNVDDPKYLSFSDHNNAPYTGRGGSNFTTNNITIDPTINDDYNIVSRMERQNPNANFGAINRKNKDYVENVLYPNVEPLIKIKNYEEVTVGVPALPKETKVTSSPMPRTKTDIDAEELFKGTITSNYLTRPDTLKTFPTRKDYTHSHYQNDLTNLFHIRYTKNADIGDGVDDTFIWHEGQSDIAQKRSHPKTGEPVPVQVDKANPKTGIARSLEGRYREAELADEFLQKRSKAIEENKRREASIQRGERVTPTVGKRFLDDNPDYFTLRPGDNRKPASAPIIDGTIARKKIARLLGKETDDIEALNEDESISRVIDNIEKSVNPAKNEMSLIKDIDYLHKEPTINLAQPANEAIKTKIIPEIPFIKGDVIDKSKIDNLMFQRALKQAIDSGHTKFAWPTSETISKFSGGRDAPIGVLKTYDVDFINIAKKIYNGTKKSNDPSFEEWWRMEERVRPISFEGTFKIKEDVSLPDLLEIGESVVNGLAIKKENRSKAIQRLENAIPKEVVPEALVSIEERKQAINFAKLELNAMPDGQPILDRIFQIENFIKENNLPSNFEDDFLINILPEDYEQIMSYKKYIIKSINEIYRKPVGDTVKEFKPHQLPGVKGKDGKPVIVNNLMPHPETNSSVGDLGKNSNIQNYYVMEITPEMKAMFSRPIPFNRGGIVQDKMDTQMNSLFGQEQIEQ